MAPMRMPMILRITSPSSLLPPQTDTISEGPKRTSPFSDKFNPSIVLGI